MFGDIKKQTCLVDSIGQIGSIARCNRIILKMTQDQVAEKAKVSRRSVMDLENGRSNMKFSIIINICEAVDLELMIRRYDDESYANIH